MGCVGGWRRKLWTGEQQGRPNKQPPAQGARLWVAGESHATHNALTYEGDAVTYFGLDSLRGAVAQVTVSNFKKSKIVPGPVVNFKNYVVQMILLQQQQQPMLSTHPSFSFMTR
jgi:hypothetical protein